MSTPVIMPKLGLTMTEGTIIHWLKAEGEVVEKGEPLLEILTDKANLEVEAPASGSLRIFCPEGSLVPILEVIGEVSGDQDEKSAGPPAAIGMGEPGGAR
ncbi:MAG: biotin/lipoyl-containing protein, partial [Methanocella sp.]